MANKYAGTQTEINIRTLLQKQKKKVLNKFHLYS